MHISNLVVTQLVGGLGNQMFQFAAGLGLAKSKSASLKIDSSAFRTYQLHKFDLLKWAVQSVEAEPLELKKLLEKKLFILPSKKFKEKQFSFDPEFFSINPPVYLEGYWQSEKYFKHVREELLGLFVPVLELSEYSRGIKKSISDSPCAVSLHVRRGDYLLSKNQSVHGSCGLDYYQKCIQYFENKYSDLNFFVFSDDITWAKENLKFKGQSEYVDGNGVDRNHEDMLLMSLCRHNVIANSSFSWWGAWLNKNAGQEVIAPKQWFATGKYNYQDIYCEGWMKL